MANDNSCTYVGDTFTLSFLKAEDLHVKALDTEECVLVGFKKEIRAILNHQVNALTPVPGFYMTLGDPVVRLSNGHILHVPLLNLVPTGYSFNDVNLKNANYRQAKRSFLYLRDLPSIPYNIGDKVLISNGHSEQDDAIVEILDIEVLPRGLNFIVEINGTFSTIPLCRIISLMEPGNLTELERIGKCYRRVELMREDRRISLNAFGDDISDYDEELGIYY